MKVFVFVQPCAMMLTNYQTMFCQNTEHNYNCQSFEYCVRLTINPFILEYLNFLIYAGNPRNIMFQSYRHNDLWIHQETKNRCSFVHDYDLSFVLRIVKMSLKCPVSPAQYSLVSTIYSGLLRPYVTVLRSIVYQHLQLISILCINHFEQFGNNLLLGSMRFLISYVLHN